MGKDGGMSMRVMLFFIVCWVVEVVIFRVKFSFVDLLEIVSDMFGMIVIVLVFFILR